jgi:hypothetical protein
MTAIDRRDFLATMLGGVAAASMGVGLALMPNTAEALPLALEKVPLGMPESLVEKAQTVVVTRPRRRRRVRRCWWSRGRRVCRWVWV